MSIPSLNLSINAMYILWIFTCDNTVYTLHMLREECKKPLKILIHIYIWHTLFFIRINIGISFLTKWNHKYQNVLAYLQLFDIEKTKRLLDICVLEYVPLVFESRDYAYDLCWSYRRKREKKITEWKGVRACVSSRAERWNLKVNAKRWHTRLNKNVTNKMEAKWSDKRKR